MQDATPRAPIRGLVPAGFGLLSAVLLVSGAVSYCNAERLIANDARVAHSREVLTAMEGFQLSLTDADGSLRAFLLSGPGDGELLRPYRDDVGRVHEQFSRLREITEEDPGQQERLDELARAADAKLSQMDRLTRLRRERGAEAALARVLAGEGRRRMDAVRSAVADMKAREQELLGERARESAASAAASRWAIPLGTAVSLAVVGFAYVLVGRDAAARLRLELQARELAQVDARKNEFLATLGHELRNPLGPIRTGLAVLRQQCDGDPAVDRLSTMMERQVANLARLVDDLFDISRIERGKVELRKSAVDLADAVSRAAETARPTLDERGHRLALSLPDRPVWVEADPDRLAQIFGNLLTNADRYTPAGGRVSLSVRREGREAVVRVRDDGIGIRPEALKTIWETFQQADRVEGSAAEGLGLGLALVRRLTELHGGRVGAASDGPGTGSEFTVRLPALAGRPEGPGAHPGPARAGADDRAPRPVRRRVLVTDDNADAAATLAALLELDGHEVRTTRDGPEALVIARQFRPEVAVLAIGPGGGLDGFEVARRLRREPAAAGILLVALTNHGTAEDVTAALAAGFDHHLAKPADPAGVRRLLLEWRGVG